MENGELLDVLTPQLHARQQERDALRERIAATEGATRPVIDQKAITNQVHAVVAGWRDVMAGTMVGSQIEDGRQLLRTVMTGSIVFVAVACAALEGLTCNCQLLDHEHSAGSADRACTQRDPGEDLVG